MSHLQYTCVNKEAGLYDCPIIKGRNAFCIAHILYTSPHIISVNTRNVHGYELKNFDDLAVFIIKYLSDQENKL